MLASSRAGVIRFEMCRRADLTYFCSSAAARACFHGGVVVAYSLKSQPSGVNFSYRAGIAEPSVSACHRSARRMITEKKTGDQSAVVPDRPQLSALCIG
jgi:hypothetical protein